MDPSKVEDFKNTLMYCPRPLWNTHNHDHSVVTIEYIRWAVKEHFGLDPAEEPKLEYLSEKKHGI